jgi:proteasome lid subunit RPN8/RPN11
MMRHIVGRHARLRISHRLWRQTLAELARRGRASRESGAFLLAAADSDGRTVTRVVFFDDLDPNCLTGGISMAGAAFPRLWELCDREGLRVVGDVHTHPTEWVQQSGTDKANPMIAQRGHVAVIVPHYAQRGGNPARVGVHEYLGDAGWRANLGRNAKKKLYVGWWA